MRATVAVVADDLTGAADTGAGFLRAGFGTVVTWGDLTADSLADVDAEVLSIDLRTRVMDAASAAATTAAAVGALRTAGVRILYKKIDSLLRGHIADEVRAALASWDPDAIAVVAAAFPAMGRTTIDGIQHVGRKPLENGSIVDLLRAGGVTANWLGLDRFRGDLWPQEAIAEFSRNRVSAVVCDAENDDDLRWIARGGQLLRRPVLWVGTGGLAAALATTIGEPRSHIAGFASSTSGKQAILFVVGSGHPIAQEQARALHSAGVAHIVMPLETLNGDGSAEGAALTAVVVRHLRNQEDVLVTIDPAAPGDDPRIAHALGELLRESGDVAGAAVLTGGDTATGALRAWGVRGLRLVEEVERGVPLSISFGKRTLPVVTKAGAFGHPETLLRARDRLKQILGKAKPPE